MRTCAFLTMMLLLAGSVFAEVSESTVNSVARAFTQGPGGSGIGDDDIGVGWSGTNAYSHCGGQVQHDGSDALYGFAATGQSAVTSLGDLKAYSTTTGEGVFDLQYSANAHAEYHKYFQLESDNASTTRATVRVTISFDGSLRATSGYGAADPDEFATSVASAGINATATYWGVSPPDEEGGSGPVLGDGSDGEGFVIDPPTPYWEAWEYGRAGIGVKNGYFDTYAYGKLYEANGLNCQMVGDLDSEVMTITGTLDSSAVFEFTVEDLTQIIDLEVRLETSVGIVGYGGSIAGGTNNSTYFSHYAESDFWNTGTFEIESVYDPDNPSAVIAVNPVPEPATLGLLALGGGLVLIRRRRTA